MSRRRISPVPKGNGYHCKRQVFRLAFCNGRGDRARTCGIQFPKLARYQLRYTSKSIFNFICYSATNLLPFWKLTLRCPKTDSQLRYTSLFRYQISDYRSQISDYYSKSYYILCGFYCQVILMRLYNKCSFR